MSSRLFAGNAMSTTPLAIKACKHGAGEQMRTNQAGDITQWSPVPEGPQVGVSWYDAAAYCNWLSAREGLEPSQWCYEPNSDGAFDKGMKIAGDFLERLGYRLPTEAEWEYACRAEVRASRYCGGSPALLKHYAWYIQNSSERARPCGRLKPNDLGLFDMLGNVYEWCQDRYKEGAPSEIDDNIYTFNVSQSLSNEEILIFRGGSSTDRPADVRSAYRNWSQPSGHDFDSGFRPARTYRRSP